MNWIQLTEDKQLQEIEQASHQQPVVIFKHSTRCSISATALSRLERNWKDEEMIGVRTYYLDLISYRTLSTRIVHEFGVEHQSPQVLVIQNGESVYDASHWDIAYTEIKKQLEKVNN